ncbi:substrate-binding domain-containing protein [Deinococcus peraridilitoris]|uniref:Transcriptional regulator n=1 Tax=Deinococcus peraridilitoris (strain DSM 19664 / LMG 22246 / CIP 109416 / KR-200) TaxID=937777 RepID=L0A8I4_DEIPD|nr:substrate-binding domain-containing protein [Deinococcus peraridilitoris]AFZ69734.1 transcriptional regulator [Deinococcus peraridilitoris DSM 19664]
MNLKRLSHHLGLSATTVSRALAGYNDVNEETRQRVIEAAREFNYQPNRAAQRLRLGKSDAIGLVLPVPPQQFASPFFSELIAGIGEVLAQAGLDLLVTACPPGPQETEYYRRMIQGKRVDGAIVVRTRVHDERVTFLQTAGVPFVTHGRTKTNVPYAYLDVDGERGFYEAARFLLELGHTRIALINAPEPLSIHAVRHAGYVRALRETGLELNPALLFTGDLDEVGGHRAAEVLLKGPNPPTAFLCVNDLTAFGVMHGVADLGLQVGKDVSVIGYEDLPFARYSNPPLTTLSTSSRKAGQHLARMQLQLLSGVSPAELQELWAPELVLRASHAPVPTHPEDHTSSAAISPHSPRQARSIPSSSRPQHD